MWEGLIELKYTGGFDRAQVYRRAGWNSSICSSIRGLDGTQVYRRV